MNEVYAGCFTAEWQSHEALQEMLKDPAYSDVGPDQEAAMRSVVVADFDAALAYLHTIDDQVHGTEQICGPWYYADDQRWAYERVWYDD